MERGVGGERERRTERGERERERTWKMENKGAREEGFREAT